MKFLTLTYAALCLVSSVNCDGSPTLTSSYIPKGKFSVSQSTKSNSPPYSGTVFIDENVLTDKDPNALRKLIKYKGQACRTIWHQHLEKWVDIRPYLFKMLFKDKIKFYVWVDPKYGSVSKARKMAKKVTLSFGSLPEFLRRNIHVIAILSEGEGANADTSGGVITWHEKTFNEDGLYVEEVNLHEGAHASVDNAIYGTSAWDDAVQADPTYISEYAKDHPDSEDVAESFGAWYALRSSRLKKSDKIKIRNAIPNRLALFDKLYSKKKTDWYPVSGEKSGREYKMPTKRDYGDWYHC